MADYRLPNRSLDDAIDRGVRALMDVEPRPGFERRVMLRLERPARRVFAWPQFAAAAVALTTALVVALVLREAPRPRPGDDPTRFTTTGRTTPTLPPTRTGAVTTPHVAHAPTVTAPALPTERVGTRTPRSAARPDVMAANVEEETPAESQIPSIAALDPPSALAVAGIEQRPVTIPDITMLPLEIEELNVEPLPALEDGGKE